MKNRLLTAFTLIELLIVVAIIAILAAIAVPNFLEAQIRSKVSRAKADMRTCAIALQCYQVDNNRVIMNNGQPTWDFLRWQDMSGTISGVGWELTTPIAYLTSIPMDVFNTASVRKDQSPHRMAYHNIDAASYWYVRPMVTGEDMLFWTGAPVGFKYGWCLESAGPDCVLWPEGYVDNSSPIPWAFYDPTNGTVSSGDIWYFNSAGLVGGGGR